MKQKGLKFDKKQNFAKADNYLDNLDKNFFFFNYLFFFFALNYSFLHSFICATSIEYPGNCFHFPLHTAGLSASQQGLGRRCGKAELGRWWWIRKG